MDRGFDIPTTFYPKNDPGLQRDLNRLGSGLDRLLRELSRLYRPRWEPLPIVIGDTFAAFDCVTRITPTSGATVIVQLPRANSKDGGRELRVQRTNTNGTIYLVPPDALINGAARYHMLNNIGFVTVLWDGAGYYTETAGAAP